MNDLRINQNLHLLRKPLESNDGARPNLERFIQSQKDIPNNEQISGQEHTTPYIEVFFYTGIPLLSEENKESLMQSITAEINLYEDILVFDIVDSYKNITQKTLALYNYVLHLCPSKTTPKYLMKGDDDILINWPVFYQVLKEMPGLLSKQDSLTFAPNLYLFGGVHTKATIVRPKSSVEEIGINLQLENNEISDVISLLEENQDINKGKLVNFLTEQRWALPEWLWPGSSFDFDYLMGAAFLQSFQSVQTILKVAKCLDRLLFIDDLFLAGYLPHKLKIPVINDERFLIKFKFRSFMKQIRSLEKPFLFRTPFAIVPQLEPDQLLFVWNYTLAQRTNTYM